MRSCPSGRHTTSRPRTPGELDEAHLPRFGQVSHPEWSDLLCLLRLALAIATLIGTRNPGFEPAMEVEKNGAKGKRGFRGRSFECPVRFAQSVRGIDHRNSERS